MSIEFMSDFERGIDPTNQFPKDCSQYQNAPIVDRIPAWWLEEGTPEQVAEWKRQLESGEAILDT